MDGRLERLSTRPPRSAASARGSTRFADRVLAGRLAAGVLRRGQTEKLISCRALASRSKSPSSAHKPTAYTVGPQLFGPRPGSFYDLPGEHVGRDRKVDDAGVEHARSGRGALEVQPHEWRDRPGEPVDRDVVVHLVVADRALRLSVVVRPGLELLEDPRGQSNRGVRERVIRGSAVEWLVRASSRC
jgi:hypothetical protein